MITNKLQFLILSLLVFSWAASPIVTQPWNGHQGAVTFTFDDACQSQVDNVLPALSERGITATFFVFQSTFTTNQSTWVAAAQGGNEIANHTLSHTDLTTLSDASSITAQVSDWATTLRGLDSSIEAVTLAYPYCNSNTQVDSLVNKENIIARTCGGTAQFTWSNTPSNWMRMTSFIVSDDASYANAISGIQNAATNNTWFVTLDHGVGGDWLSITAAQAESMFDEAISDSVWIAPYQTIAAYWRAGLTLDTVEAVSTDSGWTMSWVSPHTKMPRSVPVRINLDASLLGSNGVLSQNGSEIAPEEDGSYVIEFMDLHLDVLQKSTEGLEPSTESSVFHVQALRRNGAIELQGLAAGEYVYQLCNLSGRLVEKGSLVSSGTGAVTVSISGKSGVLLLRLTSEQNASPLWTVLLADGE